MLTQGKTKTNQTSPTANTKPLMAYGDVPVRPWKLGLLLETLSSCFLSCLGHSARSRSKKLWICMESSVRIQSHSRVKYPDINPGYLNCTFKHVKNSIDLSGTVWILNVKDVLESMGGGRLGMHVITSLSPYQHCFSVEKNQWVLSSHCESLREKEL